MTITALFDPRMTYEHTRNSLPTERPLTKDSRKHEAIHRQRDYLSHKRVTKKVEVIF